MSWQQPGGGGAYNPNAASWTPPGMAGRGGAGYPPQQPMGGYPPQQMGGGGYPPYAGGGGAPYYPQQGGYGGYPPQQQGGYGGGYPQQQQQAGYAPYGAFGGLGQPGAAAPFAPTGVMARPQQQTGAPAGATMAPRTAAPAPAPAPAPADDGSAKLLLGGGRKSEPIVMPKKSGKGKIISLSDDPKPAAAASPAPDATAPTGASPTAPTPAPQTASPEPSATVDPKPKEASAPAAAAAAAPVAAAPPKPAPKKAQKEYARDPRPHYNIVFCGHVDAGKSTVSGHLLVDHGLVDEREMAKLKKEAEQHHREGWEYAYVLDVSEQERERGKTHEVGSAYFTTEHRRITILDAPGHKAFVPSMIGGATQADLAVMVISARVGEFETGFEKGGQTREHTLLLRTCGIKHLICVVNKMDDINWDVERYNEIVSKTQPFFRSNGFDERNKSLVYMPISALRGAGLTLPVERSLCSWYDGPCFIDYVNRLTLPQARTDTDPLCLPIAGSYKDDGKTFIYGKVESGSLVVGEEVMMLPTKQMVVIEGLSVETSEIEKAYCGDTVHVKIRGVDENEIHPGFTFVNQGSTMKAVEFFQARIVVLEVKNILSAGSRMMLHMHAAAEEVSIHKILGKLDKKTLEPVEKDPSHAKAGDMILARLALEHPLTMEVHKDFDKMGRFMLRDEGRTIAIGLVTKLYESTKESLAKEGKQ